MRREAYLAAGGHDKGLGMFPDDWEATIAMLAKGIRGVMLPYPLFRYRIRPGSTFRAKANQWIVNYEYIVAKHEPFFARYACEIISFLNANGSNLGYHNPTLPSSNPAPGAALPGAYAQGRLYRLVRAYYVFTNEYPVGRRLRRVLAPLSPVLSALMSGLYGLYRRGRRT